MEPMANLSRIFGPPGTGKTTWIAHNAQLAYSRGRSVMLVSLTRAAARAIAQRDLPIDDDNIGTLHSHCFKALGNPKIAEAQVKEWNELNPAYAITSAKRADPDDDDVDPGATVARFANGDDFLAVMGRLRARMVPRREWATQVQMFARAWDSWKRDHGYLDFHDLIEQAIERNLYPLCNPDTIFVDESQDLDRAQMTLVRQWGAQCRDLVIVGDADQAIYTFRGSDPEAFLLPPELPGKRRVLSRSYRVPVAAHDYAMRWIKQCSDRAEVEYLPRVDKDDQPVIGELNQSTATLDNPEAAIDDVEARLERGQSAMLLTTCSYMLHGVIGELRARGVPYHNPYRVTRGDWNPMRGGVERVRAFVDPDHPFRGDNLSRWTEIIRADGNIKRGGKKWVEGLKSTQTVDLGEMLEWFDDAAVGAFLGGDVDWLRANALDRFRDQLDYPIEIYRRRGYQALAETPRVVVGTIHSVKGGEADAVYLWPDLSHSGTQEWQVTNSPGHDAIRRQMYVGLTRCRDALTLCQPTSAASAVTW